MRFLYLHGKLTLSCVIFCLLLTLFAAYSYSQELQDVSSYVSVTRANERSVLDRRTNLITSTADLTLTNISDKIISSPLHGVIAISNANGPVQMPDADGGPGTQPYDKYYYDLSGRIGSGSLPPGGSVSFSVKFVRSSTVRFTYNVSTYGIIAENLPPILTVPPSVSLDEMTTLDVAVTATDPDGDSVTLTTSALPGFAGFTVVNGTGTLALTPGYTHAGSYNFTFTATDSKGASSSAGMNVTVNNINSPPLITSSPMVTADEGQSYSYQPVIDNQDMDVLTFSLIQSTAGMAIDSGGLLAWIPSAMHVGRHDVQIQVSDGNGGTYVQSFSITVAAGSDRVAPQVSIACPTQVQTSAGMDIEAQATDNVGISRVSFYVDGLHIKDSTSPPHRITYNAPEYAGVRLNIRVSASDEAGNSSEAVAEVSVIAEPDTISPVISGIFLPATAAPGDTITVGVDVTDDRGVGEVRFSYEGALVNTDRAPPYEISFDIPLTVQPFTPLAIDVEAFDAGGNSSIATGSMIIGLATDIEVPSSVTINAPAESLAGRTIQLSASAVDNVGIHKVVFFADGVQIAEDTAPPYQSSYNIPDDRVAGSQISFTARAFDFSSNSTDSSTLYLHIIAPQEGFLIGEVYDDSTGLPAVGATVRVVSAGGRTLSQAIETTTDNRGRYSFLLTEGEASIEINKTGFTTVYREEVVLPGAMAKVFDARITPSGNSSVMNRLTGGNIIIDDNRISLYVPPGAFTEDVPVTLDRLSGQALPGLLPPGWAPVSVVHAGPDDLAVNSDLELIIRGAEGMCEDVIYPPNPCRMIAARWDSEVREWVRIPAEVLTGENRILLRLHEMGTIALVRMDLLPSSPEIPASGAKLSGVALQVIPAGVTADIMPGPRILFMQPGVKSDVSAVFDVTEPFSSGTRIEVDFNELYERKDNTFLSPEPMTQDIILYQGPSGPEGRFPASPSEMFDPLLLEEGVITITAHRPAGTDGSGVTGPSGGTISSPDGLTLNIPSGALTSVTPVSLDLIGPEDAVLAGDARFITMAGVEVDVNGASLSTPLELTINLTEAVDPAAQLLVVRPVRAEGVTQYELVGVAEISGNTLTIGNSQSGLPFPGIVEGGRYYFVQLTGPAGYVTGSIEVSGQPVFNGLVTVDTLPFVSLTGTSKPFYAVASSAGTASVTGNDLTNGGTATGAVVIGERNQITTLNLNLVESRPSVVSVSPSDGASDVQVMSSVTVRFSGTMDPSTINSNSFTVLRGSVPVQGSVTLLPDGTAAVFRPDSPLSEHSFYQVLLSDSITDSFGHSLSGNQPDGAFISVFTTIDVTPPARPEAGQITMSPPQNGISFISGTQGSVEPGVTVTVKNIKTGIITSVISSDDGSFSVSIQTGLTDGIELILQDSSGNSTTLNMGRVPPPPGTAVLGGNGGVIEGDGGIGAIIPAGVLPEDTVVTIKPVDISDVPPPFTPEMDGYIAAAMSFDMGSVEIEDVMEMTFSVMGYSRYTVVDRVPLFELNQNITLPTDITPGAPLKLRVTGLDKFNQSAEIEVELPIVAENPDTTPRTVVSHTTPVLKLTLPAQAMPGQTIGIIAKAEPPDIKLRIPAPQDLTGEEQFILYSLHNINGKIYYALADTASLRTLEDGRQVIESNSPPYRGVKKYNDALAFAIYKHLTMSFAEVLISGIQARTLTDFASFSSDFYELTNEINLADILFRNFGRQRPPVVTPYEFAVIPVPGGLPTTINIMDLNTNDIIYEASIPAINPGELSSVIVIGEDDNNDPMVTSTTSFANHAIPVDAGITISFSHAMDASTLNSTNLYIEDENGNRIESTILLPDNGSPVYVVTVKPNSLLQSDKSYTLIATSSIKRVSGQTIDQYEMDFKTAAPEQIGFISISNARSFDVLEDVAVVAINSGSGTDNGFKTVDLSDPANPTILGTIDLDPAYNGPVRGIKALRYKDGRDFAILTHGAKNNTFSKVLLYSIEDPAGPVKLAQKSVGLSNELLVLCSETAVSDTGGLDDIEVMDFCKSSIIRGVPAVPTVPTVIDTDGKQNIYFINNGVGIMTIDAERLLANQDSFGPSYLPADKAGRLVVTKDPSLLQDDGHLKITSPSADPYDAGTTTPVTISGEVQDKDIAAILVNGFKAVIQPAASSGGNRTFSVNVPIHEGYNLIIATGLGIDGGKLGSVSLQVIRDFASDPLEGPGTLTIGNPTEFISTYSNSTISVSASVTDKVKFDQIFINGQLLSKKQCPFSERHPEWKDCGWSGGNGDSIDVTLKPGLNSLIATAIDVDEFDPPMLGYSDLRMVEGVTLSIPVVVGTLDIFDTSSLAPIRSLPMSTVGGGMRVSGAVRVMTDIDDDGRTGLLENDDTGDTVSTKTDIDDDGKITVLDELKNLALVGHGTQDGGKLTFVDITEPHRATALGYIEGLGAAYRAWVDSESGIAYLAAGSTVKMIDITHPAHDGLWDTDSDGKDDRILNSITVSGDAVDIKVDKKKGLIYVLLRGSGVAILNTCCQDVGVDATRIPVEQEVRSSTLEKERSDLLHFIKTAMTQISECSSKFSLTGGGGTEKIALLAQGSSACIWRSDERCSSAYQPGISDYDFEFMAPESMRGDAMKCTEKIERCMGQKEDVCQDSDKAVFDDVSVFFVPRDEFVNAYRSVSPVNGKCGAGADPYADLCLGRNGNMVKWILEGEWVKDGSTLYNNSINLNDVFATLRSPMTSDNPATAADEDPQDLFITVTPPYVEPSHIPRLEGKEWACLEDFALNYSGARIRILGDGVGDVPINNPKFLTAVHKAAKAGIRAVFGRLLANDAGNALMLESSRREYNSDHGCHTGYSGSGSPSSISDLIEKRCESFEEYVASQAIRSVERGLGILTGAEALQAHEMYRRKADVGTQILTEEDANKFISDTMQFIDDLRNNTSVNNIYNSTILYYSDSVTRTQNYNKCTGTNVPDYEPGGAKLKLKIPVRVYNNSYLSSSDIPVAFKHDGTEALDPRHTIERLAPGASEYITKNESDEWVFSIKPEASGTHSVQFVVDPDDEFNESDKSNNYDGFHYYILNTGNTTPPAAPNGDYRPAAPTNIPDPPASDACLDDNGNAPESPALQLITTVNDQYDVSIEPGVSVTLKATVRNFGNVDIKNISIDEPRVGNVGTISSLAAGSSADVSTSYSVPSAKGLYLVIVTAKGDVTVDSQDFSTGIVSSYNKINVFVPCSDTDGDGNTDCGGDCNNNDATVNVDAAEVCDGRDNNCNNLTDEGFDADGDGYSVCGGDCNDGDAAINPGATEVCDGIDNDCNPQTSELTDGDGDGYAVCDGDCDDSEVTINPGATEVCDGLDNNCNNLIDEGSDTDGDGYTVCAGDCNDGDPAINPGVAEVCDGTDNDCNSRTDEGFDNDSDGYSICQRDCNDNNRRVRPDTSIEDSISSFMYAGSVASEITFNYVMTDYPRKSQNLRRGHEIDGCSVPAIFGVVTPGGDVQNPTGGTYGLADTSFGRDERPTPIPHGSAPSYDLPCNKHDICYQTCGSDRAVCDDLMYQDMEAVCNAAYPTMICPYADVNRCISYWTELATCHNFATAYKWGLDHFAGWAWRERQLQYCDGCP